MIKSFKGITGFLFFICLLGISACVQKPKAPGSAEHNLAEQHLPADCNAAIDTFITNDKQHTDPELAIRSFNQLAHKYKGVDTMAYASIRAYTAQTWDISHNGDSVIAACEDALEYFDNQPIYLDMRTMCHLYMGWGYYYKKNQLTANYFFSLAGNDMTDTVFIPHRKKYITCMYPPATKAALLEEIAGMARLSGLYEQARSYIRLSLQNLALIPEHDSYLACFINLEASSIYVALKKYDSSAYYLQQVAHDTAGIKIPAVWETYLEHKAEYFLETDQFDSAIAASVAFQKLTRLDSASPTSNSNLFALAKAYAANGEYAKSAATLKVLEPSMKDGQAVMSEMRISYLEAKAANLLAEHTGIEGYRLIKKYSNAKDELYDQQRLSAITDMDARYKMRRKEEAIRQLNSDNVAYARKVRRQSKILVIAALSLLLVIAIAIIINQRQARLRLQENVDRMELEQRLLRSQMEPHFIFNTLAVLQGLIRQEEKALSIKYLSQFARLLRISLEHARESFVPLKGEVEALGHYLGLQQIRFQNAFTYIIDAWEDYEAESEELMIPPMLLQPFAENAVHHGMNGFADGEGRIAIRLEKELHCIRFTIEDNGSGYDPDALPEAGKKQSLATVITRERLAILSRNSGHPASLSITSAKGMGTRVTLVIPFTLPINQLHV